MAGSARGSRAAARSFYDSSECVGRVVGPAAVSSTRSAKLATTAPASRHRQNRPPPGRLRRVDAVDQKGGYPPPASAPRAEHRLLEPAACREGWELSTWPRFRARYSGSPQPGRHGLLRRRRLGPGEHEVSRGPAPGPRPRARGCPLQDRPSSTESAGNATAATSAFEERGAQLARQLVGERHGDRIEVIRPTRMWLSALVPLSEVGSIAMKRDISPPPGAARSRGRIRPANVPSGSART